MENFTPLSALAGGALVGLSATLVMALLGRVTGISGIVTGAYTNLSTFADGERFWRVLFVLGVIAAPTAHMLISGSAPDFTLAAGAPVVIFAGFLVGFGTRLGSGCTSGHGVCGLARLSPRSAVAVAVFMATAIATHAVHQAIGG